MASRKTADEKADDRKRVLSLIAQAKKYRHDPLGFVKKSFPWKSGELAEHEGPDVWQEDILKQAAKLGPKEAMRIAVASGHGIGKSALVCWLIIWAMVTFEGTKGVITANTETQLRTKTWAELAKWYQLCEYRDCLTFQATSIFSSLEEHEKTWRIDMVPWSERSTEAFAGLHNQNKRIILIFDEASAIPDIIWETSQGALTDNNTEILWCVFGNPTRPSGRFFECFNKYRHRWECRQIDSRTCRLSNKEEIDGWVKDEGEDSDYIRIRVRGVFPRRGSMQFIDSELVKAAVARQGEAYSFEAFILGMDIARYGDDASRIVPRRGRDAKTWAVRTMRGVDLMTQASVLIQEIESGRPDAVFIDEGGVGGGVIDRARQLGYNPIGVQFGGSATNGATGNGDLGRFANKRAEMWGAMREWLKVGAIPNDMDLIADLTSIEYTFNPRDEILLEKKEDMKRRGLSSPDFADALALTFAFPVYPRSQDAGRRGHTSELDPFRREPQDG